MKKFIARSIMILCLFCAAAVPALAGEAPGQAPPAMSQPAARQPPLRHLPPPPRRPLPVTQKALE